MNKKTIENYIVNEKLDLDKIVDDYSSYVKTIINKMLSLFYGKIIMTIKIYML